MILTKDIVDYIVKETLSVERRAQRLEDYKRFLMFNGKTKKIIQEEIAKSYKKPETIEELSSRIIPINIVQKIINKLAGVYVEAPSRNVVDKNQSDQDLLELYVHYMNLNQRMKEANRYFKLFKRNLMELYVDDMGNPWARNLPRHTYEVYSFSSLTPNRPDVVVKVLKDDADPSQCKLSITSDENHLVVDGKASIDANAMANMQNEGLINPYGKMPFVYTNESSFSVDPIQDDDLVQTSIAIQVILSDLCFAQKYSSWGILYTVGDVGDIPVNPNSVVQLNFGPEGEVPSINTVKPDVDTEKVILLIKTMLAMLMSTKNLSTSSVRVEIDSSDVASGISKMLDNAESIEDKKDQQQYFYNAEAELWQLLSKNLIPYWRKNNMLNPKLSGEFSPNFEVAVLFQEPKVLVTDKEKVELSTMRLEAGLSTLEQELKYLYPQKDQEEIDLLLLELEKSKAENIVRQVMIEDDSEDSSDEAEEDGET